MLYTGRAAENGVSYQCTSNTGDNASDFVAAKRTPGATEVSDGAEKTMPEYTYGNPHTTGGVNMLVSEWTNRGSWVR